MKFQAKQKLSNYKGAQKQTGRGDPPAPLDQETEGVLQASNADVEFDGIFDMETSDEAVAPDGVPVINRWLTMI